jgi:D-alanine-D-alanine ligase
MKFPACLPSMSSKQIDREKYSLILIGIRDGHWVKAENASKKSESGEWRDSEGRSGPFSGCDGKVPDPAGRRTFIRRYGLMPFFRSCTDSTEKTGPYRDFLKLAQIPLWATAFLLPRWAWTNCMRRSSFPAIGVRQAAYEAVTREELKEDAEVVSRVEKHFPIRYL